MTESEWLVSNDPQPMRGFIRDRASDRKVRLLAVAACRRVWNLFKDKRSKRSIETAELFADQQADVKQLDAALTDAFQAYEAATYRKSSGKAFVTRCLFAQAAQFVVDSPTLYSPEAVRITAYQGWEALATISRAVAKLRPYAVIEAVPFPEGDMTFGSGLTPTETLSLEEQLAQANFIRDIFGNPFRPVAVDPAWLTSTVVSLSRQMYESRDFSTMPILADALQDAGCENTDILNHCRSGGPHVRGCFVVDLLLGKE